MIFDVNDMFDLEEEYKFKLEEKEKEIERLNNIIDKAIEYIVERTFDEVSIAPFIDDFDFKDNILKILRGEDNVEN